MLARLCEQQQAIVEFQLQHAHVSRSAEQNHFTTNNWASMRDLCALLRCFEYSTNMARVPMTPFSAMMEEDVAQEEEEEEEEES